MMRRVVVWLLLVLVGGTLLPSPPVIAQCPTQPDDPPPASPAFEPGQILVRFQSTLARGQAAQIVAAEGVQPVRRIPGLDVDLLQLPAGRSVQEAVERFLRYPDVAFAEPNYLLSLAQMDDPGLTNQWAPQILEAPAAWAITAGDPAVLIAVTDTGVDYGHSELAPNIWTNPGEVPDNGLDDDGNGYVDDVRGWDFYNGDPDPMDDHFHGTHVAGIAAAAANDNPDGLVGICPGCTILPVKVLDANGSAPLDVVAEGMVYAADNGAKAINLSLGASIPAATLQSAVDYAWERGAVVVAAAGNNGAQIPFYPAGYANAIGVASTTSQDERSCFSNYGADLVAVAAPGEDIYSSVLRDQGGDDAYASHSGTSMAAPHVAGLVGLLFSQDPQRSNAEVRALLETTAEDLGSVGHDAFFGAGRINARRALMNESSPVPPAPGLYATSPIASAYANARKLVRDGAGRLHLAWHQQVGDEYQILHATSEDDGLHWSSPEPIFASTAETYQSALAADGATLYLAWASLHDSSLYRVWFSRRPLEGTTWTDPVPLTDGTVDAVRPALFADAAANRLHLVAGSLDNAPYVYYLVSEDMGDTWGAAQAVPVSTGGPQNSRYAAIHAHGQHIYLAGRTVEMLFGLLPRFRTFTVDSTDGGQTWSQPEALTEYLGFLSGAYGVSLAGVRDQVTLAYEHAGTVYVQSRTAGESWGAASAVGDGAWPSLTLAAGGQAWVLWESEGSLFLRHYTGVAWDPAETVLPGNVLLNASYANLKLGTSGDRLDWVFTQCPGAPFRLVVGGQPVTPSPVFRLYLPVVSRQVTP